MRLPTRSWKMQSPRERLWQRYGVCVAKNMLTSSPKQSTIVLVPIPYSTVVWSPYHAVLYCGLAPIPYHTVVWSPFHTIVVWSPFHAIFTIHMHTSSRLKRSNKLVAPNLRSFLRQANKVHGSQSS